MRTAANSSAIVPFPPSQRSFPRRRVRAMFDSLTCLVLFKHGENATQLFVSDDADPVGAIWLHRAPLLVERKDRGRFLVVTLTRTLAQQKGIALRIIDRARFTPEERSDLEDAIATAARARKRLSGREDALPFPGRNAFA